MADVWPRRRSAIVLPPVGNYAIGLLKDTSIASIIAAPELMLRAKDLASSSFMPMQLYVLAARPLFRDELSALARRAAARTRSWLDRPQAGAGASTGKSKQDWQQRRERR